MLPADLRKLDRLHSGQKFEIERIQAGQYLIKASGQTEPGLLKWLRECPEKNWFQSVPSESTADLK